MKITSSQLQQFASSPKAFRDALLIDSDSGPRPFSSVMDPWQREDFESMDPAWQKLAGHDVDVPYRRAWLERPRGHSKTTDIAVSVIWGLAFSQRMLAGVCAAVDRSQSRLLRNAVNRIVLQNSWLKGSIDVQHSVVKNPRTGSELEILSSDAPSSFGRTPSFIVADELCHWESSDLWESLFSAAGKKRDCLLQVITNAGWTESWQFDLRESVRADAGWFFHRLDGPQASWLDQERLAEQKRLLPDPAYRRLWLNEWSSGSGDALSPESIERAVKHSGPMGRERGWVFVAGLDLGVSRDHSAFAVMGRHVGYSENKVSKEKPKSELNSVLQDLGFASPPLPIESDDFEHHEGTHQLRLANIQSWKPPKKGQVDLQAVEDAILYAHSAYNLQAVFYDPHQAEFLAQRLRRAGVRMTPTPFTPANLQSMASTLIEAYASDYEISIYNHNELLIQLKQLRIVEKSYGFRLESPRNKSGHGDLATAFVLALFGIKKFRGIPTLTRPLLHEGLNNQFEVEERIINNTLGIEW